MPCPDDSAILDFVHGRAAEDVAGSIERHLDSCSGCRCVVADAASVFDSESRASTIDDRTLILAGSDRVASALTPGQEIGRYVIERIVGEGAMGRIYAARDPALDRMVALKVVKPELRDAGNVRERMFREAKAMAQVAHPNVVAIHDVLSLGDDLVLAMELVEGPTLSTWLDERPRSCAEIVRAFLAAGAGLVAAHDRGVVHRDFKPHNVLVGTDGRIRVTDFGLARSLPEAIGTTTRWRDLTSVGQIAGTPAFFAPEQILGGPIDARTDEFSFCVALHRALYGMHPFGDESMRARIERMKRDEICSPERSDVPEAIRAILCRGLRFRAEERYPSLAALLHDLERSIAPRSEPRGGARWVAAAIAAGLLVMVAWVALPERPVIVTPVIETQQPEANLERAVRTSSAVRVRTPEPRSDPPAPRPRRVRSTSRSGQRGRASRKQEETSHGDQLIDPFPARGPDGRAHP